MNTLTIPNIYNFPTETSISNSARHNNQSCLDLILISHMIDLDEYDDESATRGGQLPIGYRKKN